MATSGYSLYPATCPSINAALCIFFFQSMRNSSASIVLALSPARLDLMIAPQVENRRSTVAEEAGILKYTLVEYP